MKKMLWLCCIPFVLLAFLISFFLIIPNQMSFPFTISKGDSSMLKDITFNFTIQSGLEDSKSGALFVDVSNKEGDVSYQLKQNERQVDVNNEMRVNLSDMVFSYDSQNRTQIENDPECTIKEEEVHELPLNFQIDVVTNEQYQSLYDEKDQLITLQTNLSYKNDDEKTLYKTNRTCKNSDSGNVYYQENQSYIKFKDEQVFYSQTDNPTIKEDAKTYYFMPKTNRYVEGENAVYKINLSTYNKYGVKQYKATSTPMFTLPQGRYYHYLSKMNNQFIVFAYDEHQSYLMRYDKEGTLLEERILGDVFDDSWSYVSQNDNYFIFLSKAYIYVMNMNSYEIVERYHTKLDNGMLTIYDAIYKNNILYILDNLYEEGMSTPSTSMFYEIRGIKNGSLMLQARQDCVSGTKVQEYNYYQQVYRMEFKR